MLEEIAAIAEGEQVDLVIVAGDLFDTSTPTPESEEIVYRALLALTHGGAPVAVISGNHDHARRLRAVAPLLELGSIQLVAGAHPTRRRRRAADHDRRRPRRAAGDAAVRLQARHRPLRRPDGRRGVRERPALQRSDAPADRGPVRLASAPTP